tara:strand:- start:129 stop:485 length:357 start_codon:yes stop_codon:yes gene_type:complete
MKESKKIAEANGILIAGILTDSAIMEKKTKPILSFEERLEIAKSIKYIDKVIPQESYSPLQNLNKIKPDILMESSSHAEEDIDKARDYMEFINGEVMILPYYDAQSSTRIKDLIKNEG